MNKTLATVLCVLAAASLMTACKKDEQGSNKVPVYKTLTVSDFVKQSAGDQYYNLKGTIEEITDARYSQFTLKDKTGSISVSGLWDSEGGSRVYDMAGYKVGDAISIAAQRSEYRGEPEAKNAYVYDPSTISLSIKPLSMTIGAEGGEIKADMFADGVVAIVPDVKWISAEFDAKANSLVVKVEASNELEPRVGSVTVSCGSTSLKVRVSQDAFTPEIMSIADAVNSSLARVKGVISASNSEGYVLNDGKGAIFVKSESFLGLRHGIEMTVTGSVSTSNHLTAITPVNSEKGNEVETSFYAEELDAAGLEARVSGIASESADKARVLSFVKVQGRLSNIDGTYILSDRKTKAEMAIIDECKDGNLEEFDLQAVDVTGYIGECKDGKAHIIVASVSATPFNSIISIDGDFSDWQNEAVSVSTTYDPAYPAIVELRGYVDAIGVYVYWRSEKRSFLHNVRICIDTDANPETGKNHWCLPGKGYEIMFNMDPFGLQGAYYAPDGGDTLISSLNGSVSSAHVSDDDADTAEFEMMIPREKLEAEFALTEETINIGLYALGNPYWNKTATMPSDHALSVLVNND